MNKELKILVGRLERIFPHLKLWYEGEYFETDIPSGKKLSDIEKTALYEDDFAPPKEYDWYDIIKILDENGLEIRNKKDN